MPILYTIPLALSTEQLPRRQGIREHLDLMSGLPLAEQWALFQLVPAEQIRVRLTSSAMVISRKSISMVIGMGQWGGADGGSAIKLCRSLVGR